MLSTCRAIEYICHSIERELMLMGSSWRLHASLRSSLLAQKVAAAFNDPARRGSTLTAGTVHFPSGSIVNVPDPAALGGKAAYLIEPFLEQTSRWNKWTNNDGTPDVSGSAVPEVLSTFSHFSLVHIFSLDHIPLMILDIQVSFMASLAHV